MTTPFRRRIAGARRATYTVRVDFLQFPFLIYLLVGTVRARNERRDAIIGGETTSKALSIQSVFAAVETQYRSAMRPVLVDRTTQASSLATGPNARAQCPPGIKSIVSSPMNESHAAMHAYLAGCGSCCCCCCNCWKWAGTPSLYLYRTLSRVLLLVLYSIVQSEIDFRSIDETDVLYIQAMCRRVGVEVLITTPESTTQVNYHSAVDTGLTFSEVRHCAKSFILSL